MEYLILKISSAGSKMAGPLRVNCRWLRTDLAPTSGMANVIVEIPTGYIISRDTIEWMYTAGFVGLKRVRFYNQQLVTFFEYVSLAPPEMMNCKLFS